MRQSILEKGGALLTEYFAQQTPGFGTFQVRNRLITGLACGVLLLQAARKSGTVMYASFAKEQNRDVFVWPGPQGDPAFAGGWDLMEDGAKAVERGRGDPGGIQPPVCRQGENDLAARCAPGGTGPRRRAAWRRWRTPASRQLSRAQAQCWQPWRKAPQAVAQLEEATGLPAGSFWAP